MKLCTVIFGLLAVCAVSYAVEYGPLMAALQPRVVPDERQIMLVEQPGPGRQKRSLLLGGAALGAAALGAGVLGAGALGAGIIGAKAGLVGGVLAAKAFSGRGYGGYGGGYGGGYYGGGGNYGGYYAAPVYRSYPTYIVEDEWC